MYSTLGKHCPFGGSNRHFKFCTQFELEHGVKNGLKLSSTKFDISQSVYDEPPIQKTQNFLDTPFHSSLLTPEEAKVIQNPNNAGNR